MRLQHVCLVVMLSGVPVLASAEKIIVRRDNLTELNNDRHQTPCNLTAQLSSSSSCQSSQSRRGLNPRSNSTGLPSPTNCTCNTVFFNLWSACQCSLGNNSLPTFGAWESACQNKSLNVTANTPDKTFDIPSWAFASVSSNSTFVLDNALSTVQGTKAGWTPLQIALPIVVSIGTLIAVLFGVFCCRGRSNVRKWSSTILQRTRLRPRARQVRRGRRDGWSIDRPDAEEYFAVDDYKQRSSRNSFKGQHARLSSSDTISVPTLSGSGGPPVPLKTRIMQQFQDLSDQFRLPWNHATQVQSKPPRRGFRVDSWDVSTTAPSNLSHPRTAAMEVSEPGTILEEEENDAEVSLLSPVDRTEDSILLVGHPPNSNSSEISSTMRSVQVVPPTPTDSSHASIMHPTQQSLLSSTYTQLPPTPTQRAPLPPSSPLRDPIRLQRSAETLFHSEPAGYRPKPTILPPSPLLRYDSPERDTGSPGHVQHTLPRVASPPNAGRQLPMAPQTNQNGGLFRPHNLASPSSIESLYVDFTHTAPSQQRSLSDLRAAPSHQRSLSDLRPLPTPGVESPRTMSPLFSPRPTIEEELARQDQFSSRSSNGLQHPRSSSPFHSARSLSPLSPRRRDTNDSIVTIESLYDQDNFHHQAQSRNISHESVIPGRGDPVMLFPGSVRAAGYAPHSSPSTPPPVYHDANT